MLTRDQYKALALAHGFKLKEQPNGEMDLNPYVYDCLDAVYRAALDEAIAAVKKTPNAINAVLALRALKEGK